MRKLNKIRLRRLLLVALEQVALLCAGKLFKSTDLPMVIEFFLMFHRDKPIDWLLDHLLFVKVCSPEKDNVSNLCIHF